MFPESSDFTQVDPTQNSVVMCHVSRDFNIFTGLVLMGSTEV